MEVRFKNGKIVEYKTDNPDELSYVNHMFISINRNFTGTLKFEFTDPVGEELEIKCKDMYAGLTEDGKDPAKDRWFISLVRKLSKMREPFAYYGPEEFHGLHHDGKTMPYLFADFHARALAGLVSHGQQDREDRLYDAFCKGMEDYNAYINDIMKRMFGKATI